MTESAAGRRLAVLGVALLCAGSFVGCHGGSPQAEAVTAIHPCAERKQADDSTWKPVRTFDHRLTVRLPADARVLTDTGTQVWAVSAGTFAYKVTDHREPSNPAHWCAQVVAGRPARVLWEVADAYAGRGTYMIAVFPVSRTRDVHLIGFARSPAEPDELAGILASARLEN